VGFKDKVSIPVPSLKFLFPLVMIIIEKNSSSCSAHTIMIKIRLDTLNNQINIMIANTLNVQNIININDIVKHHDDNNNDSNDNDDKGHLF